MIESKEHDKLFADLEALNEQQIELGLAAGVWNEQVRPLVQHYLYDLKLKRVEAAAEELDETRVRSISPINADRGPLMGRHRNIEILRVHRSDSENLQTESRNADRSPWVRVASWEVPKHPVRRDRDGVGASLG